MRLKILVASVAMLAGAGLVALPSTAHAATPVSITTTSLPDAVPLTAYSATLDAAGGTPVYTWAVVSGSLPTGLSLSSSGSISGSPVVQETSVFTVQVTDSLAQSAEASLSITVDENPVVSIVEFGLLGYVQSLTQQAIGLIGVAVGQVGCLNEALPLMTRSPCLFNGF
jgi:hypothetical protein